MNFKKTAAIAAAVGALGAVSVPAFALENEFKGMYRAYGYYTNALSGAGGFNLKDSATDKFIEQRARLMYTAKASADLKLVTHFELDTKFGGSTNAKYANAGAAGSDAGGLDADRVTLETKNVYIDFNCPLTGSKVLVGIVPFSDAYQGTWGNFDTTALVVSKKFGAFTGTYVYAAAAQADLTGSTFNSDRNTLDVNILDGRFAVSKDLTLGANYYNVLGPNSTNYQMNMLGLNAAGKFGPAALTASFGYQFGNQDIARNVDINAFGGAVAAKIDAGPGKVNLSFLYLSGDNGVLVNKDKGWQVASAGTTYFTPANMWLITRNAATINSSTAIGGSSDLTRGGRGIMGFFAGYEGAADKLYYNANVGYAQVDEKRTAASDEIGTEINATVGYKLYPALSISATAAYAFLGDGYGKSTGTLLPGGVANADDPFLTNVALNFSF